MHDLHLQPSSEATPPTPLTPSTVIEGDSLVQACGDTASPEGTPLPRIYPAARRARFGLALVAASIISLYAWIGLSGALFALLTGETQDERSGVGALVVFIGGILVVPLTVVVAVQRRLNSTLQRELIRRFSASVPADGGEYVGLAIGEEPLLYHTSSDWDIGLLSLEPGRLRYLGDRCGFELRPEHVSDVFTAPFPYNWSYLARGVYVEWRDPSTHQQGVLTFRRHENLSLFTRGRFQRSLCARLEAWLRNDRPSPNSSPDLPRPPERVEGGTSPSAPPIVQFWKAMRTRDDESKSWSLPIPAEAPVADGNQLPIPQTSISLPSTRDLPRI